MKKIKGVATSRLWDSLESLVAACEEAFTCDETDMMEDADDDVSIPPMGLTFGQIWKARDALNNLREHMLNTGTEGDVVQRVVANLRQAAEAYPADLFGEVKDSDPADVVQRAAAQMGRNMAPTLTEAADMIERLSAQRREHRARHKSYKRRLWIAPGRVQDWLAKEYDLLVSWQQVEAAMNTRFEGEPDPPHPDQQGGEAL